MVRFLPFAVALTISVSLCPYSAFGAEAEDDVEACQDLSVLGTPNWDRFGGELEIEVDDDCMYTWTVTFKHDETLPLPDDPANQCDPSVTPPVLAADGLPYYAFRWSYLSAPDSFKEATGVDHVSIDFNPCGHPPVGIFTVPHYDLHTYRVTPEYRTCMQCELLPGTPVCDFNEDAQTTDSGKAFFAEVTKNIPPNFVNSATDAVPVMGGHAWDLATQPANASVWTDPIVITGHYDDRFLYYEPMAPISFFTGDEDKLWEQTISYENQDIDNLATSMSISYDASTGETKVAFKGPSSVCNDEPSAAGLGRGWNLILTLVSLAVAYSAFH